MLRIQIFKIFKNNMKKLLKDFSIYVNAFKKNISEIKKTELSKGILLLYN